jgi:Uncharacterized conserved protein
MKLQAYTVLRLCIAAIGMLSLQSCFKDRCDRIYTLYKPVYQTLSEVRANMKSNSPRELKQPGKLYIYGNYIFLNEYDKGIHVIDNTQPASPKNVAFIDIPGNVDLAVNGNTLYADSYCDMVTFDITNPRNVSVKKINEKVFPGRATYYMNYGASDPDSVKIITDWITKDTSMGCEDYTILYEAYYSISSADKAGNYASPGIGGKGGSMARYTILNNYLYTVTYSDLNVFDISTPQDPSLVGTNAISNFMIETIYPFKNKLFIGGTNGMFIYDASSPATPVKLGQFTHARNCDPVVADDHYAWVTLRSNLASCGGNLNQLDVVNISDLMNPTLLKSYPMASPHGLSKDGNLLFICDGAEGLKIYNAKDANNLQLIKHIKNMETYDVIAWNQKAMVVAKDGLYQFDYADVANIRLISKIRINRAD